MATDTKDLEQVVTLVAHLGNAIGRSLEDGKVTVTDLANFITVLPEIPAAVIGIQNVPGEAMNLTQEQRDEMASYFADQFDIPEDAIEAIIEKAIAIALQLVNFSISFKKK